MLFMKQETVIAHCLLSIIAVASVMPSVPLPPERYQVKTGTIRGPYKKKNP